MNKSSSTFIRITALAILASFAEVSLGGEAESYCELTEAQAKTSSALLASPEIFGNIGDPVSAQKSATVGIRHSLARSRRASLTDQIAQTECSAYRAEQRLAEQAASVESRAELLSVVRSETAWASALALAEKSLQKERQMLEVQQSRLADLNAAYAQVDLARREIASGKARMSRLMHVIPDTDQPLRPLLEDAINLRSKAADLSAALHKTNAWDLSYAAGMRSDLRASGRQGFVALTASWSFGQSESARASAKISQLSSQFLHERREGEFQRYVRARESVAARLTAELLTLESYKQRQELLQETQGRLQPVSTTDGERMKRVLAVEQLILGAYTAESQARVDFFSDWVAKNAQ